ncbi:MAG TPA: methylmalonyl-CoA mutase family protein [Chryseolinea sp.]|nr:methylmalonyl-CoA mutase family protein [Chryseolinea sp.]
MSEHALLDQLLNSFPKSNKEEWSRAASKEIGGKDPLEHLTWESSDEINFLPYYDLENNTALEYLKSFTLCSTVSSTSARTWSCVPKISLPSNKNANAIALNHLANGADGILFDFAQSFNPDLDSLLSEIHWPFCNVSFLVTPPTNLIQLIIEYAGKKNYDPKLLTGTIFCKRERNNDYHELKEVEPYKMLRVLGIQIPSSSPIKEISSALIQAAALMDTLTDAGYNKDFIWRNLSFSLASGKNFLIDIAKQKTLRLLLYQLGQAFELKHYTEVEINIRVEPWTDERFQPHGNMISGSVAAIAAVAGGCDSLTILAEDENNATMTRIARNVSNILREESHMNKVADPTAGSYAIDNIIDRLAVAAWREFQHNMTQL